MSNNGYAQPQVLVTTEWAEAHLNDPNIRFIEVDVDTAAYDAGHIPGAVGWNWTTDTQDTLRRDIPDKAAFAALLGRSGIGNDTTVVLYGDNNNWFATYAFWLFKLYGALWDLMGLTAYMGSSKEMLVTMQVQPETAKEAVNHLDTIATSCDRLEFVVKTFHETTVGSTMEIVGDQVQVVA